MGQRHVFVQADLVLGQRVPLAQGANVAVFHQLDVAHLGVGVERCIHGKIQAASGQLLGGFAAARQHAFNIHVGAIRRRRWNSGGKMIASVRSVMLMRKVLLAWAGLKDAAFLHGDAQLLQGIAYRADDVLRHWRGHHALGGAHKQRVIKGFAQARQGVGYGGLSNADDLPGAGQVGLGVDGIEDDKEVEIDLVEIHYTLALQVVGISGSYIGDECLYTMRID